MPAKRSKRTRASTERTRQVSKGFFANSLPEETREQWHPLASDPGLQAAGVEIGARMITRPREPPKLRIVFRAQGNEASTECVHVAVYVGSLESLPTDEVLARSSKKHPVDLAPEEHFFALNSYVAGIAEVGLGTMFNIAAAAGTGNLAVGFNTLMQKQVWNALFHVAPIAALDFFLWITEVDVNAERAAFLLPEFFDSFRDGMIPELARDSEEIAAFAKIPQIYFDRLAAYKNEDIRSGVASHKNVSPSTIARLATDKSVNVRGVVARRKDLLPEVSARLAEDTNYTVRSVVARNEHSSPSTLARLSVDKNSIVRSAVATNQKTSPEILTQLGEDSNSYVRFHILKNTKTPREIQKRLAGDPSLKPEFFSLGDPEILARRGIALDENTPPETLAHLALDDDVEVRMWVAGNRNTSQKVLVFLAGDEDFRVRRAVFENGNTPLEGLNLLTGMERP